MSTEYYCDPPVPFEQMATSLPVGLEALQTDADGELMADKRVLTDGENCLWLMATGKYPLVRFGANKVEGILQALATHHQCAIHDYLGLEKYTPQKRT